MCAVCVCVCVCGCVGVCVCVCVWGGGGGIFFKEEVNYKVIFSVEYFALDLTYILVIVAAAPAGT